MAANAARRLMPDAFATHRCVVQPVHLARNSAVDRRRLFSNSPVDRAQSLSNLPRDGHRLFGCSIVRRMRRRAFRTARIRRRCRSISVCCSPPTACRREITAAPLRRPIKPRARRTGFCDEERNLSWRQTGRQFCPHLKPHAAAADHASHAYSNAVFPSEPRNTLLRA